MLVLISEHLLSRARQRAVLSYVNRAEPPKRLSTPHQADSRQQAYIIVVMRFAAWAILLAACAVRADVRDCVCDLARPDIAEVRGCSLCIEAAKHPAAEQVIIVRDSDPTKPNRWLALPRAVYDGANPLGRMSAAERLELWNAAIAKGVEMWGNGWGVAMNGDTARRQCHAHVHIGKLLEGKENDNGVYVESAAQLPAISDGTGLWFHPLNGKLHVHAGEQITETVLMR